MNDIITNVKEELVNLRSTPQGEHIKTGDIRKLSASIFRNLKDKSKENVFLLCQSLLKQRNWPMGVIAFSLAYRVKEQYDEHTFAIFESWLSQYVRGWGDCDDFCTHAFGELICQNTALSERLVTWTKQEEFWMRRAAAVILIPSIWRVKYDETNPLRISNLLLLDKNVLVLKGYGWMLKELSIKEPDLVFEYLYKQKDLMPRISFRYALTKMDADKKDRLLR